MSEFEPLVSTGDATLNELLDRETLNQVSALQALSQGDFLGSIPIGELKKLGDTGIGTFDKLDGELIMLDGVVYKAHADGSVSVVPDDETTPFADVTFMDSDLVFEVEQVCDMAELTADLTGKVERLNPNLFYMVKAECELAWLKVRSAVKRYEDASTSLAEHMKEAERVYEHSNIRGTLVALYCPAFMASLNLPGWHLHFLSEDHSVGGHVLDLTMNSGTVHMDQTRCFTMVLPDADGRFADMDLTLDQSADLHEVESSN